MILIKISSIKDLIFERELWKENWKECEILDIFGPGHTLAEYLKQIYVMKPTLMSFIEAMLP